MTRRMQAIIKLAAVSNLGPSKTRKIFTRLQQEETELEFLIEFNQEDLISLGLDANQAQQFLDEEAAEASEFLSEQGVGLITTLDTSAPSRMIHSKSSPWYFYFGRDDILQEKALGFAGSRDASPEAIELTTAIAGKAAAEGWSVISGGARGVDLAAHTAVLENGGHTVILLPQGISTWKLPEALDLERVLILSEFLPHEDWGAYRAMQRNKSVVELTDFLIIPQSGERGGTWNAGEYALKQNRPVYVAELKQRFPGNKKLIKLGASALEWRGDFSVFAGATTANEKDEPSQVSLF